MRTVLKTACGAAALLLIASGNPTVAAAPLTILAAADVAPDATEQLLWQSADRLATPDAYRAYLARYPSGFFAPMANAALSKSAEPPKAQARPAAMQISDPGGALNPFTASASSAAVSFDIGETFSGPTSVAVGRFGAKKMLVLPAGKWIALAAQDEIAYLPSSGGGGTTPVTLTTASFGRFAGSRLVSLMTFKFSAQKMTASSWSSVDGCERAGTSKLQGSRPTKSAWRGECVALAFDSTPLADALPATAEFQRSLARLGATVSGPALVSTWSYTEKQRGFLGITRFDWPGPMLGNDAQAARDWMAENLTGDRQVFATRLWTWAQGYVPFAIGGFENDAIDDGKGLKDFTPFASK